LPQIIYHIDYELKKQIVIINKINNNYNLITLATLFNQINEVITIDNYIKILLH